ncbi:MAG: protein kinase [Gemmatimonadaceae bacterium]
MSADLQRELQDVVGDTYQIERELGGGGMSRIFVATERSLGRRVVVKVLPPDLVSGVSEARFQREILVTANLQHPHILPVLSAGANSDLHYYITPYVEGQSLRDRLTLDGPMATADAVQMLRDLASALAYAHSRGIIHRDVKPENVLLSGDHPILADFGIASAVRRATQAHRLTVTGENPGTPGYMAPEQMIEERETDPRIDVFALGVVGYELFTGKLPFEGRTPHAMAAAYFGGPPPSFASFKKDVPAAVTAAIARALSTDPSQRFPDAGAFLAAMRSSAAGDRSARTRRIAGMVGIGALLAAGILYVALRSEQPAPNAPAAEASRNMVAVLPFRNLGDASDAYFADGVTEEVTSRLATLGGLGVISRTSADQYANSTRPLREIARELGADYILEGSVRWQRAPGGGGGGRVRVTPQLIRVSDDSHVWAEALDADLKDVFTVQSQIAAKVAEALAIALPGAQRQRMGSTPTANLKAYDAYIRGDQLFSREGAIPTSLVRAAQLFTDAVTADPQFAVAFARLSLVHARLYEMFADHTPRRLELARQASDSALALDPSLPEGHLARGRFFEATDDLERAAAEYALAVKGKPNDSQILAAGAAVMARRGQWTESTNQFRRAAQLDPRSVQVNLDASVVYSFSRDYRTAMRYVEQAILADSGVIEPWITKGRLELFLLGDRARARETMRGIILRFGAERAASAEGFDFAPLVLDSADLNILARVPATAFGSDPLSYHFFRTQLFEAWQPARARAHADTVFMIAQDLVKRESNNFRVASGTAYMNAITGHRDVAISEMRRALQLTPSTRDRTAWSEVATMAMRVYTIVGENDAAIDQIEQLVTTPALMSAAFIRTEPRVASLRNSPRLQAILARAP